MDHHRLGAGRRGVALAVSSRAASGLAARRASGCSAAAFVRLALNPAVLEYHARSATPIFNWYFYAYGIVTAACLPGRSWLRRRAISWRKPMLTLARRSRHRAGVSTVEHRNRGLFQQPRLDLDVSIHRQFRARHDLFHRLGVVCPGAAGGRHCQKDARRALRRDGAVVRDAVETFPPRSGAARANFTASARFSAWR